MKTTMSLLVASIALTGCAQMQTITPPEWKVTLRVVDESGQPVAKAKAEVEYIKPGTSGTALRLDGLTDTNGQFSATERSWGRLYLHVSKTGFHSANSLYDIGASATVRYEPWNPTITLLLKKIGQPIAMYAKAVRTHVPDLDKAVGYDLMVGDWVGPFGKGINADINFTGHFDKHDDGASDFTLTVSFPNAGDGIQEFSIPESEKSSELRSPHEAPADGYQPQWVQYDNRKPNTKIKTNRDLNRNYFFRVRTKLDEKGNVVSARYGKIYGDFMTFTYYLNPTPNDRNIEFDPKQNLIHNLKSDESVSAP
jgi:hypothetical protein